MKKKKADIGKLVDNIDVVNLAEKIDDTTINKIVRKVIGGYEYDLQSRKEWQETAEEGIKIAGQIVEEKSYPWPGAANIKYPMVATAAIQFASRAYPQILDSTGGLVKAKVYGSDPEGIKAAKAERVGRHMSWQMQYHKILYAQLHYFYKDMCFYSQYLQPLLYQQFCLNYYLT